MFELEDRYSPRGEAAKIRRGLNEYGRPHVRFAAYNEEEKNAIAALLTPEERARVTFTWWAWGARHV